MADFVIPSVSDLDPASADYVSALEQRLGAIDDEFKALGDRSIQALEAAAARVIGTLRGIEGVVVDEEPRTDLKGTLGGQRIRLVDIPFYVTLPSYVTVQRKETGRKIEDLLHALEREIDDGQRTHDDYIRALNRAHEDHYDALVALTKYTVLVAQSGGPTRGQQHEQHIVIYFSLASEIHREHYRIQDDTAVLINSLELSGVTSHMLKGTKTRAEADPTLPPFRNDYAVCTLLIENPSTIPDHDAMIRHVYRLMAAEEEKPPMATAVSQAATSGAPAL